MASTKDMPCSRYFVRVHCPFRCMINMSSSLLLYSHLKGCTSQEASSAGLDVQDGVQQPPVLLSCAGDLDRTMSLDLLMMHTVDLLCRLFPVQPHTATSYRWILHQENQIGRCAQTFSRQNIWHYTGLTSIWLFLIPLFTITFSHCITQIVHSVATDLPHPVQYNIEKVRTIPLEVPPQTPDLIV